MYYALQICGNPASKEYMWPIEFIRDGGDDEEDDTDLPVLKALAEKEMIDKLKGHPLYEAGWVRIVKIDV